MSHGGGDESAESDLTPLLDLVLQMLMFFIVNVNLATEQANPELRLPDSTSATPVSKPVVGDVYLNQRVTNQELLDKLRNEDAIRLQEDKSILFISGQEPMSMAQARKWLKDEYDKLGKEEAEKVTIHFRPDGDLDVNELMKLMQAVKDAKFKKIQMHALVKREE